jgi:hypothetical protein
MGRIFEPGDRLDIAHDGGTGLGIGLKGACGKASRAQPAQPEGYPSLRETPRRSGYRVWVVRLRQASARDRSPVGPAFGRAWQGA